MSQKASNSVFRRDVNSASHNQVLGLNTVVTKQNGSEKARLPFCHDSGLQEVTHIYNPFESSNPVISKDLDSQTTGHYYNGCERSKAIPSNKNAILTTDTSQILPLSNRFHVLQDQLLLEEGSENLENVNGTDCLTEDCVY